MAGIFDLFSHKPADAVQAVQPQAATAVVPAVAPTELAAPVDPMAGFGTIWEALQKQNTETVDPSKTGFDPSKLATALKDTQVVGAIPAEAAAAIAAGGEGAVAAMQALLNETAKTSLVQATNASNRMLETALAKMNTTLEARVADIAKSQAVQNSLFADMPQLNNPAVLPLVNAVKAGITANNPTMTADQIKAETVKYFKTFSQVTNPAAATAEVQADKGATDWFKYLDLTPPKA